MRRLHKAFLRYHDPENWPILREALKRMGRADLIGNGKHHLIPAYQPVAPRAGAPAPHPRRFARSTRDCPRSGTGAQARAQDRADRRVRPGLSFRVFLLATLACGAIKVPGCLAVSGRNSST